MTIPQTRLQEQVRTGEIAGRPVVLQYTNVAAEYAALRAGALLTDRSHRTRTSLSGSKAAELLTGLVTNDVQSLAPGQGQYAAVLTPKGKIIADVRIFATNEGFLLDVAPRAAVGWREMLRKYINPRLAPYRDVTEETRDLGVFGLQARRMTSELTGLSGTALAALPPYGHLDASVGGVSVIVAHVPELGLEGYELFAPAEEGDALFERLTAAGATAGGLLAWDIARIEAGRPEWGLDIDDTTLPQEANFDELHAISYTKGCYVGQETVARVHFRGRVNRHLRGLRFVCPEPPAHHAELFDANEKVVGDVRSAAISPRLGGVAIGMVRREIDMGTALSARWSGGECRVDVCFLPFAL